MKRVLLFLLLLVVAGVYADDVRVTMKDGSIFEGELTEENDNSFFIKSGDKLKIAPKEKTSQVDNIKIGYNYEFPNLKLLPVSVLAFGLAIDNFHEYSDLKELDDEGFGSTALNAEMNRKMVYGIGFMLTGILNTVISLDRVEIEGSSKYLGLRWKF